MGASPKTHLIALGVIVAASILVDHDGWAPKAIKFGGGWVAAVSIVVSICRHAPSVLAAWHLFIASARSDATGVFVEGRKVKAPSTPRYRRTAFVRGLVAMFVISNVLALVPSVEALAQSNSQSVTPGIKLTANGDGTTTNWTKSAACSTYAACVQEDDNASDNATTELGMSATGSMSLALTDMPADFYRMVTIYFRTNARRSTGSGTNLTLRVVTTDNGTTSVGGSATWNAGTLTTGWTQFESSQQDLTTSNNTRSIWNSAYLKLTSSNTNVKVSSVSIRGTYLTTSGGISQTGFTFENDDQAQSSSDVGANSVQGGGLVSGNTELTNVKKGERLTVRTQLESSGVDSSPLGLFYDRNDGYFSRVKSGVPAVTRAGSNCDDANFDCTSIDSAINGAKSTSMAIDSKGNPWVAYYDTVDTALKVASYVGSGGNGCGTSTAWSCTAVTKAGDTGKFPSILVDSTDHIWISYWDDTNDQLMVAQGMPGSGCGTGGAPGWTCGVVKTSVTMNTSNPDGTGDATSIDIGIYGDPRIAYHDATVDKVFIAEYWGGGATGCDGAGLWAGCDAPVDDAGGSKVAFVNDANASSWMAWYDSSNRLTVGHYVGSGGTGCVIGATWDCDIVESAGIGLNPSIAMSPQGVPYIAYYDNAGSNQRLKIAVHRNGATGGTGCGGTDAAYWDCSVVDESSADVGKNPSLSFGPAGQAWISYFDDTNDTVRIARQYGTGNCGGASGWTCTALKATSSSGAYPALAFASDGTAWISQIDANDDLQGINLVRRGEMVIAPGRAGTSTTTAGLATPLTTSHSDMTSATDTSNKNDADCLSASTWTNGAWFNTEDGTLDLPASAMCTEVAWTIDTAPAISGTSYRFVVSMADGAVSGRYPWRGPTSITAYPKLTLESSTSLRYSKDVLPGSATACNDSTWTCLPAITNVDWNDLPIAMEVDAGGNPWAIYFDTITYAYKSARYVGSGGSGCGNSAWNCEVMDTPGHNTLEGSLDIAVGPDGSAWVVWSDMNVSYEDLHVAHYVGANGAGCVGTTKWSCWAVSAYEFSGGGANITVDQSGTPWIGNWHYQDGTGHVTVIKYVGQAGGWASPSPCYTSEPSWSCERVIAGDGWTGKVAIDPNGKPWVLGTVSDGGGNGEVRTVVGEFVGSGGTGCANERWKCTIIADTAGSNRVDDAYQLNFDANANPWVLYTKYDKTDADNTTIAMLAHNDGGSHSSCPGGPSTWDCIQVSTSIPAAVTSPSLAMDATGAPWVAFGTGWYGTGAGVARYVGSGGSGCGVGITAFSCTQVLTTPNGARPSLVFDRSGIPWIFDLATDTGFPVVAHMNLPPTPLSYAPTSATLADPRNASTSDLRWRLDSGHAPRSETATTCSATSDVKGYCGVSYDDSNYDSVSGAAYGTPVYAVAMSVSSYNSPPVTKWKGQSTVAPSSSALTMQAYNYTTSSWVNVTTTTNTCTSTGANTDCTIIGGPTGTSSQFYVADGSSYWASFRIYQAPSSSAPTMKTNLLRPMEPPNPAATLQQTTNGATTISTGAWISQTSVVFNADATDGDSSDTLALCVEAQPIASSFANTETNCGTGVAYSGSAVSTSVTLTLTTGTQYHWQARIKDTTNQYSAWSSYGLNAESAADVGIDTSAPTTGTVYDGTGIGTDASYNNSSLDALSANWSGFADAQSGIASYQYSIGTSAGATDLLGWTSIGSTSVTASGLTLRTTQSYFFNVRALNNAGTTSTTVSSNGQSVAPTLTFSVDMATVAFDPLSVLNSHTGTKSVTLTTSTNAYSGYAIRQWATPMTSITGATIADYSAAYPAATTWAATGMGYTSSDTAIQGLGNIFGGATKYAAIASSEQGDVVADHTASVSGTPIVNEQFTLTYKIAAISTQTAGSYSRTVTISCTALW